MREVPEKKLNFDLEIHVQPMVKRGSKSLSGTNVSKTLHFINPSSKMVEDTFR